MSLDPPGYVLNLQNNVRSRPIPWEGAVRAKTLTEADFKKIKTIDKVRKEQRKATLEAETDSYVALFLGGKGEPGVFQAASKRTDIMHYLLVLLDDSITDSPTFTSALLKNPEPFEPFIPLIKQSPGSDDPLPLLAGLVLTKLISSAVMTSSKPPSKLDSAIKSLFAYLSILSKTSDTGSQDIAVQSYSAILRNDKTRKLFWEQRKDTVAPLMDILRAGAGAKGSSASLWSETSPTTRVPEGVAGGVGIELLYRVLLVIWQLSFEGALVGEGLLEDHEIIILYVRLLRISPKEKITRLILSTLVNLLSYNQETMLPAAVLAGLPASLKTLKSRHLSDQDLSEDLDTLTDILENYTEGQTTFDEYASEVRTGHLHWSPPHRNPTFWTENARKILEENKGELPKLLSEILSKDWENNKQVLAIGCNDVACLVREVPEKRMALEKLGLKTRMMELMQETDEAVKWESLRAVGEWLRYSFD